MFVIFACQLKTRKDDGRKCPACLSLDFTHTLISGLITGEHRSAVSERPTGGPGFDSRVGLYQRLENGNNGFYPLRSEVKD